MRRRADSGIDHHRHVALFDDDAQEVARGQPFVRPDRRAQRHHARCARLLEPFAEHRVGVDVGHDDEAVFGELFGCLEHLDRVGHQVARVGVYLELEPVRAERLARELRGENGLLRVAYARGIGQQAYLLRVDVAEDIVLRVVHLDAFERYGYHRGAAFGDRRAHQRARSEFPGSEQKPRREALACNY